MCEALRELMQDEIEEEIARGKDDTIIGNIKQLMKNMKLTAEQAMKALGIPKKEWAKYSAML